MPVLDRFILLLSELRSSFATNPKPNSQNHVKTVKCNLVFFAIRSSCQVILDNCDILLGGVKDFSSTNQTEMGGTVRTKMGSTCSGKFT